MVGDLELDVFKVPSVQIILGLCLSAPAEAVVNEHPTSQHKRETLMFADIQEKDRNQKDIS